VPNPGARVMPESKRSAAWIPARCVTRLRAKLPFFSPRVVVTVSAERVARCTAAARLESPLRVAGLYFAPFCQRRMYWEKAAWERMVG